MPAVVGDRKVYVCKGELSWTVNICNADNRRGEYEWVVRLFPPSAISEGELLGHADPEALVRWLVDEKRGQVEEEPQPEPSSEGDPPRITPTLSTQDIAWVAAAVPLVDAAINDLVVEFLAAPYRHRVEHSLHVQLYGLLTRHEHFRQEIALGGSGDTTQPVHKEWPETRQRGGRRRGNFDLAVLPPGMLLECSVADFLAGRLAAPIAIEVGLDYGAAHLDNDCKKLLHSRVPHGYLVHFTRGADDSRAEELVVNPSEGGSLKTAFASVRAGVRRYKRTDSDRITESTER
jgi:hypothetical protein